MDAPLGRAVGNALEVAECVEVLRGTGPADLADVIVRIAARMLQVGERAASEQEAEQKVRAALASGAALEKLRQMITWQGGDAGVIDDPKKLPSARHTHVIAAPKAGYVTALDALLVGRAAVALGAGRNKKSDPVDLGAGIVIHRKPHEPVTQGEPVLELRYNDPSKLDAAVTLATPAVVIGEQPGAQAPLVMGWVHEHGETMFVGGM
jgi:thymidine phosphorylase